MENKLKVWIARDKDEVLYLYSTHPFRGKFSWMSDSYDDYWLRLDRSNFPSVQWEDEEPTEAYITLAEPQEQSKQVQTIDWEQRRYEIAKEMLPVLYQQSAEILKCGQSITWEAAIAVALNFADMLIQKLKEQSE